MQQKTKKLVFLYYRYFSYLFTLLIFISPPFFKKFIQKLIFKKIGKNCLIDYETYFRYPKKISIGNNVSINKGCEFYASFQSNNGYIKIGNNVVISPNVKFYAISHDHNDINFCDISAPIIIEDNTWICSNSIILPGVKICKGSVVGAGSVVTRDVPENSIVAGNPAKFIKKKLYKSL